MKVCVIGSGLSGITSAIMLNEQGHDVEVFETREHIGGNCYDEDMDGIKVHKYGLHCFHTNDEEVWSFLNRYTKFNDHELRVRANTKYGRINIPYSLLTEQQIGKKLTDEEIYNTIFKTYSERHWVVPWSKLPKSIYNRVPTRRNSFDTRYSQHKYQGIPINGYTQMMTNMLDGIKVHTGVHENEYKKLEYDKLIYTGKPDAFFNNYFGKLPYRSLRFTHTKEKRTNLFSFNTGAQINECHDPDIKYNRTVDNSVFLNQRKTYTIYTRDYPEEHTNHNEPIYPKRFREGRVIYNKYQKAIQSEKNVIFLGRLATYSYMDMWVTIKQAIKRFKN